LFAAVVALADPPGLRKHNGQFVVAEPRRHFTRIYQQDMRRNKEGTCQMHKTRQCTAVFNIISSKNHTSSLILISIFLMLKPKCIEKLSPVQVFLRMSTLRVHCGRVLVDSRAEQVPCVAGNEGCVLPFPPKLAPKRGESQFIQVDDVIIIVVESRSLCSACVIIGVGCLELERLLLGTLLNQTRQTTKCIKYCRGVLAKTSSLCW